MLSKIFMYVRITLPNKVHSVFIYWRFIVIRVASVHRTSRYPAGAKYATLIYLSTVVCLTKFSLTETVQCRLDELYRIMNWKDVQRSSRGLIQATLL
jgi:hypothetical protein